VGVAVRNGCCTLLPVAAAAAAADVAAVAVAVAPPLLVRVVQLSIMTGELSCRSGNDEDIAVLLAILLLNLLLHVAKACDLCCCLLLVLLLWQMLLLLLNSCCCCWAAVNVLYVSVDLRVLKRRML